MNPYIVPIEKLSLDNVTVYVKNAFKQLLRSKIITKESCQCFVFNILKKGTMIHVSAISNNEFFIVAIAQLTTEQKKIFTKKKFTVKVTEDMRNEI